MSMVSEQPFQDYGGNVFTLICEDGDIYLPKGGIIEWITTTNPSSGEEFYWVKSTSLFEPMNCFQIHSKSDFIALQKSHKEYLLSLNKK